MQEQRQIGRQRRRRPPGDGDNRLRARRQRRVVRLLNAIAQEFDSACLLYTSDAADERSSVDLGGGRIFKKKTTTHNITPHSPHSTIAHK